MNTKAVRTALLVLALSPVLLLTPTAGADASSGQLTSRMAAHPAKPYINEVLTNAQEGALSG